MEDIEVMQKTVLALEAVAKQVRSLQDRLAVLEREKQALTILNGNLVNQLTGDVVLGADPQWQAEEQKAVADMYRPAALEEAGPVPMASFAGEFQFGGSYDRGTVVAWMGGLYLVTRSGQHSDLGDSVCLFAR